MKVHSSAHRGLMVISLLFVVSVVVLFMGMKSDASMSRFDKEGAVLNKNLRVGYCETEPYFNYAATLYGLLEGLQEEGLIDIPLNEFSFREGQEDSLAMWEWVSANNRMNTITFVPEAHYTLSVPGVEEALMEIISDSAELDLMIVMGTYAGQRLVKEEHNTPMMVFSTSNAVQAGIVASPLASGKDNVWAHVDLQRYQRQVRVFHELFQFKRLGMVYDDSTEGLVYAAMDDVMLMAEELGYEVVSRVVREPSEETEREAYHQALAIAYENLAGEVDAFYLTAGDWEINELKTLLSPFYQHQVPVFSQMGGLEVRHGALLSLYRANYTGIGRFGARKIGRFLAGETLGSLPQSYGDSPSIVLNMAVAEATGYKPPFDILLIADEIYHEIQ